MSIELYGLVRLRAINSPVYFNNIKTELFSAFNDEGSEELAREILERSFGKSKNINSKFNLPPVLVNKTSEVFKKIILTSGVTGNLFIDCSIKIDGLNSSFNKIKDTIADIVIKDGIVSRIDTIKYPEIE